jgi:restriction system protein
MAVPDFQRLMLPLLKLTSDGGEHTLSDTTEQLANEFQLSEVDRKELLPSGRQARLNNRVGWASSYLRKAGLLRAVRRGTFQITDRGRTILQSNPPTIDLRFLTNHFAEVVRFRGEAAEDAPASPDHALSGAFSHAC